MSPIKDHSAKTTSPRNYQLSIQSKGDSYAGNSYLAFTRNPKNNMKKKMTMEDMIEHSLNEIFLFYAKQHIKNNKAFEWMNEEMKKIDLGEF